MNKTPIIILTRDNPEYLYVTLKSLKASDIENNPILIIDNCSNFRRTLKFYNTNDEFPVTFDDWTSPSNSSQEEADKLYAETFLSIPKINKITGINKKFQVVYTPHIIDPSKILFYAIKTAFSVFPESNHCCILDDNILFNPNWLSKTLEIYNDEKYNTKIGIISMYSEIEKTPSFKYRFEPDIFRGKMMFVTRDLYNDMTAIGWFKNDIKIPSEDVNYMELARIAHSLNYSIITSEISYIQSLEKRNLSSKDKLLRLNNNFKTPIAWTGDF